MTGILTDQQISLNKQQTNRHRDVSSTSNDEPRKRTGRIA